MSRYNNFEGQKCLDNDTFKWYTDHSTLNGVAKMQEPLRGPEFYWKRLVQCKFEQIYVQRLLDRNIRLSQIVSVLTAVMSSVTVAVWAVSGKYAFVWSTLIALFQIVAAVDKVLPYHNLITNLSKANADYARLYLQMETTWVQLVEKDAPDMEFVRTSQDYLNKWHEITEAALGKYIVCKSKRLIKQVEEEKDSYFKNNFQG